MHGCEEMSKCRRRAEEMVVPGPYSSILTRWRPHCLVREGQETQPGLNNDAAHAVAVEDEIILGCVAVPDHGRLEVGGWWLEDTISNQLLY